MCKHMITGMFLCCSFLANAQTGKDTMPARQKIQEVVVSGIRAKSTMPVTQLTLNQQQIETQYYGADLPSVFNYTPSVNAYSDNGTGIGYSFFRMRGIDQTRINMTVNGIPVNDAESQGSFFNNFADLASSAGGIQIQRGVGTSTNGTASFGGSVNIQTKLLLDKPEVTLHAGYGSFNSRRLTAEYQSGLIDNAFAFYARMSDLSTDGYRDNSGSHIQSAFLSGGYFGKKSVLKINAMIGNTASTLAYMGIDQATLDTVRTTNYFIHNERDAFTQNFYQLQYSYNLNAYSGIAASLYFVNGNAPRFQYFLDGSYNTYGYMNMPDAITGKDTFYTTDAIGSYRLNQHFYGGFASYYYQKGKIDFSAGLHANSFSSEHFMEVNWARILPTGILPDHQAYFNTGYKSEMSAFAKLNYSLTDKLSVMVDIQVRNARFRYQGKDLPIHRDTFSVEDMSWVFVNPKIGMRYHLNRNLSCYGMFGMTTREPTRFDYFLDEYPHQNIRQDDIRPEKVQDIEIGINYTHAKWNIQANAFHMEFTDQLINTGQQNMVGIPITTNVSASYRQGIELDMLWKPFTYLWLMNSSAFMKSNIGNFTQYYDSAGAFTTYVGVDFNNTTAALTPAIIINQGVRIIPSGLFYLEIMGHYVSEQFLDNTEDQQLKIKEFYFVNARIGLELKKWIKAGTPSIALQVNNITDAAYVTSGNTTGNLMNYDGNGIAQKSSTGLFFPAATRNVFVTLTWKF